MTLTVGSVLEVALRTQMKTRNVPPSPDYSSRSRVEQRILTPTLKSRRVTLCRLRMG